MTFDSCFGSTLVTSSVYLLRTFGVIRNLHEFAGPSSDATIELLSLKTVQSTFPPWPVTTIDVGSEPRNSRSENMVPDRGGTSGKATIVPLEGDAWAGIAANVSSNVAAMCVSFIALLYPDLCHRWDSNPHGLSATTFSTLRVYQFRHDDVTHVFIFRTAMPNTSWAKNV